MIFKRVSEQVKHWLFFLSSEKTLPIIEIIFRRNNDNGNGNKEREEKKMIEKGYWKKVENLKRSENGKLYAGIKDGKYWVKLVTDSYTHKFIFDGYWKIVA